MACLTRFCSAAMVGFIGITCNNVAASGAGPAIFLWLSGHTAYHEETADLLAEAVKMEMPDASLKRLDIAKTPLTSPGPNDLVVAIGTDTVRYALHHHPQANLLGLFVPRVTWETMLASAPVRRGKTAVIYLDQPSRRQLVLGSLLKPSAKSVATVLGPVSQAAEPLLRQSADRRGLRLDSAYLEPDNNPVTVITPLVESNDVFIAIPDQAVFNRVLAKWVLYLSFRHKVPVIGFSRAYTDAGALASVYSTPEDIARQGAELIVQYLQDATADIWGETYSRYYTLSTNPTVARSLDIHLPGESDLYRMFEKADKDMP